MTESFDYLRDVLGPTLIFTALFIGVGFAIYWKLWGEPRIKSAIETVARSSIEQELKRVPPTVGMQPANAKSPVDAPAEVARTVAQRQLSTFSIYAERRHEHIAAMVDVFAKASDDLFTVPAAREGLPAFTARNAALIHGVTLEKNLEATKEAYRQNLLYLSDALLKVASDVIEVQKQYKTSLAETGDHAAPQTAAIGNSFCAGMQELITIARRDLRAPDEL